MLEYHFCLKRRGSLFLNYLPVTLSSPMEPGWFPNREKGWKRAGETLCILLIPLLDKNITNRANV